MSICHWLLLGVACAGTCAAPQTGSGEAHCRVAGELDFDRGTLAYHCDGQEQWRRQGEAVPYKIVCLGPPALVTTAGLDLAIATLAVGDETYRYAGLYPLLVQPPLVALSGLPAAAEATVFTTALLDSGGAVSWSAAAAELLWPAAEPADASVAYFVQAGPAADESGLDLIYPWGADPRLLAVETASGEPRWEARLEPAAPVADVQLWGLAGGRGLLSMQYDYQQFEFAVFDTADGGITARHRLAGQPASRLVYPGELGEPLEVAVEGPAVSLAVYAVDGAAQRWSFDLGSGGLEAAPFIPPARTAREENELPPGGTGVPPGRRPPFVQDLLPTQAGDKWRIPALVNERGAVLVVAGEEWQWIGDGGAEPSAVGGTE